jgi:GT2 family glycosyltransferase
MYRVPLTEDAVVALIQGDAKRRYSKWIETYDTLDDVDAARMSEEVARLAAGPLFSIIVPLESHRDTLPARLEQSMRAQVYPRWEARPVCANDLDDWNATLRATRGDFVLVVDASTVLRRHTLLLFACEIAHAPDAALVYGDEDEIDARGHRSRHYFKPNCNEALLRSQNYLGGAVCYRRDVALELGGFEEEIDGDYAWGLSLRLTASVGRQRVRHVPFVLSHRRATQVTEVDASHRLRVARAVERRLSRAARIHKVEPVGTAASYRVRYAAPEEPPVVTVIVPTTGRLHVLRPCVDSLLNRTSYRAVELLLVVSAATALAAEERRYLSTLEHAGVRILSHASLGPYNFAETNNWAVGRARGDLLCFLNDDTEVINDDWLDALAAEVVQDRVAAAGAMLFYPNDRIQHAGVVLGVGGVAAHTYRGRRRNTSGYHDRALVAQDVSCVTAACMLVRREAFSAVGCFDARLATAFNDVDLCLRLGEHGWRIVWSPSAQLYHKESASIGRHHLGERAAQWSADYELMQSRWRDRLTSDPHYNPNLSLDGLEVWQPAFPPRTAYPWRVRVPEPDLTRSGSDERC